MNGYHGHILTADRYFTENEYLRKLINKGPNFRKAITISWDRWKDVKKKKKKNSRRSYPNTTIF